MNVSGTPLENSLNVTAESWQIYAIVFGKCEEIHSDDENIDSKTTLFYQHNIHIDARITFEIN